MTELEKIIAEFERAIHTKKHGNINFATGLWQTGEPTKNGRYLVEYQQGKHEANKRVFIMDYEDGWKDAGTDVKVLRFAEINSPYIKYY